MLVTLEGWETGLGKFKPKKLLKKVVKTVKAPVKVIAKNPIARAVATGGGTLVLNKNVLKKAGALTKNPIARAVATGGAQLILNKKVLKKVASIAKSPIARAVAMSYAPTETALNLVPENDLINNSADENIEIAEANKGEPLTDYEAEAVETSSDLMDDAVEMVAELNNEETEPEENIEGLGKISIKRIVKKTVKKTPIAQKVLSKVTKITNNPIIQAVASVYPPAQAALKMVDTATMINKDAKTILDAAKKTKGAPLTKAEQTALVNTKLLLIKGAAVSQQLKSDTQTSTESKKSISDLRTRAEKYFDAGVLR
jgi:hypothetical protein